MIPLNCGYWKALVSAQTYEKSMICKKDVQSGAKPLPWLQLQKTTHLHWTTLVNKTDALPNLKSSSCWKASLLITATQEDFGCGWWSRTWASRNTRILPHRVNSRGIANKNELGLVTTHAEVTLGHNVILWHGNIMVMTVDHPPKPGKWVKHTHWGPLPKGVTGETETLTTFPWGDTHPTMQRIKTPV